MTLTAWQSYKEAGRFAIQELKSFMSFTYPLLPATFYFLEILEVQLTVGFSPSKNFWDK